MASSAQVSESLNMLFAPPPPPAVPTSSQREQPSDSQAQRPLPSAPPPPPSSAAQDPGPPHASTSAEPLFQWPGNHRGPPIRLFFDPESTRAARTRAELDVSSTSSPSSAPCRPVHLMLTAHPCLLSCRRSCPRTVTSFLWCQDPRKRRTSAWMRTTRTTTG